MSQAKYDKYHPSRTTWFDEVPAHWQVSRLKTVAAYRVSNVDKIPSDDEEPVRLCNYTDVYYHEKVHPGLDLMCTTATVAEIRRFGLRVGDVVITKDSEDWRDIAVPALITETEDDFVCGYHLAIIRPDQRRMLGPFLLRLLQAAGVNTQMQLAASGITRYSLPKSAIGEAQVPLPPIDEQRVIADFLDRETARIDELLNAQSRLRELAWLRRNELIREATRIGIPPNTNLRSNNVDWIGSIAQHWDLKKLGHMTVVVRGASPRPAGSPEFFNGDAAPWITVAEVTKDSSKYLDQTESNLTLEGERRSRRIPVGTVVLSNSGATLGVPKILRISGCINDGSVAFLQLSPEVLPDYLYYYLSSLTENYRERIRQGAGQPNLNTTIVKDTPFPLPPISEQRQIVQYLDEICARADKQLEIIDVGIRKIKEYRFALISAAVTGKIDVRNYRPQEAAALCQ